MKRPTNILLPTVLMYTSLVGPVYSLDFGSLDLLDPGDANTIIQDVTKEDERSEEVRLSEIIEEDEIESLKSDIGDAIFKSLEEEREIDLRKLEDDYLAKEKTAEDIAREVEEGKVINEEQTKEQGQSAKIFDVGSEEKNLLELSKYVESKIPSKEWNDIAAAAKEEKYVVQEGDWLWKICKKLFGSGFYYAKIWSLNPHITNPHEIEPGMTLVFDTGSADEFPTVKLGSFAEPSKKTTVQKKTKVDGIDYTDFGTNARPPWLLERQKLIDQGIFFQFASDETYEDLEKIGKKNLNAEYLKYDPPTVDIVIEEPGEVYDETGFDKDSKIVFNFKEGFFLNTFVTTNVVQDLGEIEALSTEAIFLGVGEKVYINFDDSVNVRPGEQYSVYSSEGYTSHEISEREGYRYTITAQVKTLRRVNQVWECEVTEVAGTAQRRDRVTVFTPRISQIVKQFNKRSIEAAIIASYNKGANTVTYGDVVYLDRGRADGVEMGTVFEAYSFLDRGTDRKITPDPTYKIGEITVVTLTDNFATGLITNASREIEIGTVTLTKSLEEAARATRRQKKDQLINADDLEREALDELDVELNLDDISEDLLERVENLELSEDELEELERQEREKSIIKDHEKDLRELEKLEEEIETAERVLQEAKVDEDKLLEQQSLSDIEKGSKELNKDALEDVYEIEKEFGPKYLDEELNAKENPYGLTEFDLEEIDELLNTDSDSY